MKDFLNRNLAVIIFLVVFALVIAFLVVFAMNSNPSNANEVSKAWAEAASNHYGW